MEHGVDTASNLTTSNQKPNMTTARSPTRKTEDKLSTNQLKDIHRLLVYRADCPRDALRVTVTPSPDNRRELNRNIANLSCNGETHQFEYLISHDRVIANMLANYPVPVYINGIELHRHPLPPQTYITHHPAHLPHQPLPKPRYSGEPHASRFRTTPINVDGINYIPRLQHWDHSSLFIPNPDVATDLYQACEHYQVQLFPAITTRLDSDDFFYIEGQSALCKLSEQSQQSADAFKHQALLQALQIIGTDYTPEQLDALPTHCGWDHLTVIPQPDVTPVTIDFDRNAHITDGKPLDHNILSNVELC